MSFTEFAPPATLAKLVGRTETKAAKARRLLNTGRVTVTECTPSTGFVMAFVEGDGDTYKVMGRGTWSCTCPAYGAVCSHIEAVRMVTRRVA